MFWKFDLNTTSHVDKLLDKEDVTLRELMDEDDILQECKAQNRKLLDFLCRQQCMEELVSLVTQDPPLDMEEKTRFKYVPQRRAAGRPGQCQDGQLGVGRERPLETGGGHSRGLCCCDSTAWGLVCLLCHRELQGVML